jgi:hypothetical protein
MRPEYNGHGVEQAEDDSEFDRVPQVDGQLATRVHGRETVSGNFEQKLFYFSGSDNWINF